MNYAINRGQITGTTTGMFVASNSRLVWFENAQGTRPGESALRYSGKLPENYSVIISNDGYGQLEGVDYDDDFGTIYPVSGIMTFGISNESNKIIELNYIGVLSGISQELIENEAGGTYRGAQWRLIETATDSGI